MSFLKTLHRRPSGLTGALHGKAILPEHGGYDDARRPWNLAVDQRPSAVVAAESAQDVAAAILFAREHGQRLAPQSTGHGAAPLGSLRDTVLLRTEKMSAVEIDPVARLAHVQGGAVWGDVTAAAAIHGLAAVAGVPDVGVAGYVTGGGLSFLSRALGLSCNAVEAVEIVTGDGRLRRIDAVNEPELFWAVRGGGGNFGVITALTLRLVPLREVYAGSLMFPIQRADEVLHAWAQLTRSALPDELATVGRLLKFPPIPELPEPLRGRSFVAVEAFHAGVAAEADALLADLRGLGPVMDTLAMVPASGVAAVHGDPDSPTPAAADGMLLAGLPDEAIDAFVDVAGPHACVPLLSVELRQLGGAVGRRRPDHGVLAALDAAYAMFAVTVTPVHELRLAAEREIERVKEALTPYAAQRGYLNFAETATGPEAFFAPEDLARLRAVKDEVDPDDVIRANHEL